MSKHTVEEVIANEDILQEIIRDSFCLPFLIMNLCKNDLSEVDLDKLMLLAGTATVIITLIKCEAENYLEDARLDK